jgi:hypothetical protein
MPGNETSVVLGKNSYMKAQFYIISSVILETEIHEVKFKNSPQETKLV